MTSDHRCLFLTHFVYWLQACFGTGPDMPHSGSAPEQAASVSVFCQRDKEPWWKHAMAHWTYTRMWHSHWPHQVTWPSLYHGARKHRLVGRAAGN